MLLRWKFNRSQKLKSFANWIYRRKPNTKIEQENENYIYCLSLDDGKEEITETEETNYDGQLCNFG